MEQLPDEVIRLIAQKCSMQELRTMRLLSKRVSEICTPIFVRDHLWIIHCDFSLDFFENLQLLVKNRYIAERITTLCVCYHGERRNSFGRGFQWDRMTSTDFDNVPLQLLVFPNRSTSMLQTLLSEVLINCRSFHFCECPAAVSAPPPVSQHSATPLVAANNTVETTDLRLHDALRLVLCTCARSEISIRALHVRITHIDGQVLLGLRQGAIVGNPRTSYPRTICNREELLAIMQSCVSVKDIDIEPFLWILYFPFYMTLISIAEQLERLRIAPNRFALEDVYLSAYALDLLSRLPRGGDRLSSIRVFTVAGLIIDKSDVLIEILGHMSSITELYIHHLIVWDWNNGDWIRLFESLRKISPPLRLLQFRRIRELAPDGRAAKVAFPEITQQACLAAGGKDPREYYAQPRDVFVSTPNGIRLRFEVHEVTNDVRPIQYAEDGEDWIPSTVTYCGDNMADALQYLCDFNNVRPAPGRLGAP